MNHPIRSRSGTRRSQRALLPEQRATASIAALDPGKDEDRSADIEEAFKTVEVIPGRLYTAEDLRRLLPSTLARIVIARCRMIDGILIGQAVIDILTRTFLEQADVVVTPAGGDRDQNEFMTLEEAAAYLRVSARTIRRMVEAGTITAQNLAGAGSKKALFRFSKAQLDRDMKKAETSSMTPPPSPKYRFIRS